MYQIFVSRACPCWLPRRYAPEKTEENLINMRMKELIAGREIVGQAQEEEEVSADREGRASVRSSPSIQFSGFKF